MLENLFIDRTRDNEEIPKRVVNDQEFRKVVAACLIRDVFSRLEAKKDSPYLADRSSHMVT